MKTANELHNEGKINQGQRILFSREYFVNLRSSKLKELIKIYETWATYQDGFYYWEQAAWHCHRMILLCDYSLARIDVFEGVKNV